MQKILWVGAIVAVLTACGQTGPLYLPEGDQDSEAVSDSKNTGVCGRDRLQRRQKSSRVNGQKELMLY